MSVHVNFMRFSFSVFLGIILSCNLQLKAGDFELYTAFRRISVPPGESIDYPIDVINNTESTKEADLSITGMPSGWNYTLKYGAYVIRQISVLPGEKKSLSLTVQVPLKVNKGTYRFQVVAGDFFVLPLVVTISEQGTFKTEFTSTQPYMEGIATSMFNFQASLNNSTPERQHYGLSADAPAGWVVTFRPNFRQATSVDIEANSKVDIAIDIDPPDRAQAGTYRIPIRAFTKETSANLDFEVVITGTYGMTLTTPTGLLSTSVTAGDNKRLALIINNTGSSELRNVTIGSESPINWKVEFEPDRIDVIEPGGSVRLFATIDVDKKAIAGDYVVTFESVVAETSSKATFRVIVKTPMIWGWLGIFIIVGALGLVFYLFRKYGRR
ncbi:MAG TPA: NEW3 domain-containing protein [Bacteroidales bacterium]|nr:NEW3 domain-containing protein [Bacteroidales bacterium]HQB36095.1 NEW3 domain-containing protein [Bacteroidales bacterium]